MSLFKLKDKGVVNEMAIYKDAHKKTWYVDIRFRDEAGKVRSIKKRI